MARDPKTPPGIKIQALQTVIAFQDRGAIPPAPTGDAAPRPVSPESVTAILRSLAERVPFPECVTVADAARGSFGVSDPTVAAAHIARARADALETEVVRLGDVREKADEILRRLGLVERFARYIDHEDKELRSLPSVADLRTRVEGAAASAVLGNLIARPDPSMGYRTMRELAQERRDLEESMDESPRGRHPLDRKF